ncbi:hypothetical protein [Algoriphagus hitonicola]|nr:hypothetical protein [Algoriphagus hitonicola]
MIQIQPSANPSKSSYLWIGLSFLAMVIIYFLPWRFQVNDDVIMMWLVSGIYTGESENYAVFMHPFLSYLLSFLYQHTPTVSWYSIYQYLLIFLSFAFASSVIHHSLLTKRSKTIYQSILLLVSLHLCIFPQFTLVAGWSAFAAFLLLMNFPKNKLVLVFSIFLFFFAALLRAEASLLIWLGFVWFMIAKFQKIKALHLSIALILLLVLIGSKSIYENQSEYKGYLEFNKARHQVIDHPVFFQNTIEEVYSNDPKWKVFSQWFIQESPPTLADLNLHYKELNSHYFSIKHSWVSLIRLLQVHLTELFKSFLALTFLILYWIHYRGNKKMLLFAIAWIFFFLIFNHFNHIRGRVIFLFYLPLLPPIFEQSLRFKNKFIFGLSLIILGFLLSIHIFNFLNEAKKRQSQLSQYESLIAQKALDTPIYLEGFPLEYFSRYFSSGEKTPFFIEGWIARSPFQTKAYRRLGFKELNDLESYYLIAVKEKAPFDFPDYMNSLGDDYALIETEETADLIMYRYSKNKEFN